MSGAEITGLVVAVTAFLTAMFTALGKLGAWVVNTLILKQPLATIEQLKEALEDMTVDRDFWRSRCLDRTEGDQ